MQVQLLSAELGKQIACLMSLLLPFESNCVDSLTELEDIPVWTSPAFQRPAMPSRSGLWAGLLTAAC